jgi:hypothetical protein
MRARATAMARKEMNVGDELAMVTPVCQMAGSRSR